MDLYTAYDTITFLVYVTLLDYNGAVQIALCYGFVVVDSAVVFTRVAVWILFVTEICSPLAIHNPARRVVPSLKSTPIGLEPSYDAPPLLHLFVVFHL